MLQFRSMPPLTKVALGLLVAAFVFAGWSVAQAVKVPAVNASAGRMMEPPSLSLAGDGGRAAMVAEALNSDPFRETRDKPAQRYRLPGEVTEAPVQVRGPVQLRFIGLIATIEGTERVDYAFAQLGNLPLQKLKVGEKLGEYTLVSFTNKRAVFSNVSGDQIVLTPQSTGR